MTLDFTRPDEGVIAVVHPNPIHDGSVVASVAVAADFRRIEGFKCLLHLLRRFRLLFPYAMQRLGALTPSDQIGRYDMWCSTRNAFLVYDIKVARSGLRMSLELSNIVHWNNLSS